MRMADIGSTLREARIRARIDISEVEARTKIRAKYLRAIENEEWDLLPGPVYVKSFLRTYGDFLGLDSGALLDEYKRRYERPSDHDMRPISPVRRERERRRRRPRLGPAGAIVLVLAAVVVALAFLGSLGKNNTTTTTTTTSARQPATGARSGGHGRTHHRGTPAPPGPPRPKTVSLKRHGVRVCGGRTGQEADSGRDLRHRPVDPHGEGQEAAADARERRGPDDGRRQAGSGGGRLADRL
jgi:cytoskeleton protein RodZ